MVFCECTLKLRSSRRWRDSLIDDEESSAGEVVESSRGGQARLLPGSGKTTVSIDVPGKRPRRSGRGGTVSSLPTLADSLGIYETEGSFFVGRSSQIKMFETFQVAR